MNTDNLRFRSNRMRDVIALMHAELDGLYGVGEVNAFVEMLCEAWLGWDRVQLLANKDSTINQSDLLRFHWALEDLRRQRPIQHIVGHVDFCDCRIEVTPSVLIPRPETEEMTWCLTLGPVPMGEGGVLDLCTGSGCIAIALKRAWPEAQVTAVDLSEEALAVARRNAERNGADVNFLQADILVPELSILNSQFSIIVSNPPYVRQCERAAMRANVLDHEPAMALFVDDSDPLVFYRAIAQIASKHLTDTGLLALEINEALADETADLLRGYGFRPTVHTDFRGKERWISAVR